MLKKDSIVVIKNRSKNERGVILRKFRKTGIQYYDVKTERGIVFEGLTTEANDQCYIIESISLKLNQNQ